MMNRKMMMSVGIVLTALMIFGCKKEDSPGNLNPTIKFVSGQGLAVRDTMLKVNENIIVRIELKWNGTDSLKALEVKWNDLPNGTFPLVGKELTISIPFVKSGEDKEKWTFIVVDNAGNRGEVSITFTKDPKSIYGAVIHYSPLSLGAQNNVVTTSQFLSFQSEGATYYSLEQAFLNQAQIDLFYYSDSITNSTFASPGSGVPDNIYPGPRNVNQWTFRNESRFMKSNFTQQDFTMLNTDAKIVDTWVDSLSASKAVNVQLGDIWLVKLKSGKKGAILVKRLVTGDKGEIEFSLKIQK